MLRLQKSWLSHDDVFIERYERLRSWALQLTHNDNIPTVAGFIVNFVGPDRVINSAGFTQILRRNSDSENELLNAYS